MSRLFIGSSLEFGRQEECELAFGRANEPFMELPIATFRKPKPDASSLTPAYSFPSSLLLLPCSLSLTDVCLLRTMTKHARRPTFRTYLDDDGRAQFGTLDEVPDRIGRPARGGAVGAHGFGCPTTAEESGTHSLANDPPVVRWSFD